RRSSDLNEQSGAFAHAEAVHHAAGDAVDVDEVALGAAGDVGRAEGDLLGDASAKALDDLGLEVAAAVEVAVVVRGEMGHTHRLAARLDGDLVQAVLRTGDDAGDCVSGLVVRDDLPLALLRPEAD